jgi:hypothetical protein
MVLPHSWRRRIRQSANILGDCSLQRRRDWGTRTAVVGHLGHNVLTDIVSVTFENAIVHAHCCFINAYLQLCETSCDQFLSPN